MLGREVGGGGSATSKLTVAGDGSTFPLVSVARTAKS